MFKFAPPSYADSYDVGGLATNSRKENNDQELAVASNIVNMRKHQHHHTSHRELNCLHPGDIYPFLRKPLFLIVDSENSQVFLGMPNLFGQPAIVFASPIDLPHYLQEQTRRGSLFTLFLHSPLSAFCFICNIQDVSIALWDKCQAHIDKFICDAGRLLVRHKSVDRSFIEFYGDDFLRLLILRYIFTNCVLKLHRKFRGSPSFHPHCHPRLPEGDLLLHPNLTRLVLDLACILDVLNAFREPEETVC